MKLAKNTLKLFIVTMLCLLGLGCQPQAADEHHYALKNRSLETYQDQLLAIAFASATALPLDPHIKNRARAQETVVETCFKLDQNLRAYRYIQQIPNWRAGVGHAKIASILAQSGAPTEIVEPYLTEALMVAHKADDWRKDRIKVKVAQVQNQLGLQEASSILLEEVTETAESSKMIQSEAQNCSSDEFETLMNTLGQQIGTGNFDLMSNALQAYVTLIDRFYDNPTQREQLVEALTTGWDTSPYTLRLELLEKMVQSALDHHDPVQAQQWTDEALAMTQNSQWPLRYLIPIKARLAKLCVKAGDIEQAQQQIQAGLDQFEREKQKIIDIDRAGLLRSLAEAMQSTGDSNEALELYRRTVEAGVENPNSRPRAMDLSATCCSMAISQVKPDEALWQRIHEIHDGLGDPW